MTTPTQIVGVHNVRLLCHPNSFGVTHGISFFINSEGKHITLTVQESYNHFEHDGPGGTLFTALAHSII